MKDLPDFHPSTKLFRFSILIFISLLTFGSYFAYDIIGAIAPSLVDEYTTYTLTETAIDSCSKAGLDGHILEALDPIRGIRMNRTEFIKAMSVILGDSFIRAGTIDGNIVYGKDLECLLKWAADQKARSMVGLMYTMYSIAAILSVLIGGFLIDFLGTRKASMIFSVLVFLGALIVALAHSLPVLMIGRFIFGAGSEPLIVAQSAIIARWFKNKELALAYGLALTVSRMGTFLSFNTGELIVSYFGGYSYALIMAVLCCFLSLLANVLYILIDRHGEKVHQLKETGGGDKIVFKDVKVLVSILSFWFITILCTVFYSAIFPFTALSTDFFVDKWGIPTVATGDYYFQLFNNFMNPFISGQGFTTGTFFVLNFLSQFINGFLNMLKTAGGISSIIIFASMVFAPIAGHWVDRHGRRASLMIIGSVMLIPSYLLLGLTRLYPVGPMIMLGIAFVLVPAALWPSVPMVVPKQLTGSAFGLLTMIQNIGLALFPLLNGLLRDKTHAYTASMLMFASLGIIGLTFAFLLRKSSRNLNNVLENP